MFIDTHSQPSHIQPYDLSAAASPATSTAPTRLAAPRSESRSVSPANRPSASATPPTDTPGDWDIVDDLPLRWATDYVSLSRPGTKLAGSSVLFFELWRDLAGLSGGQKTYLAVATRQCILLYESSQGERAFRIVKASCFATALWGVINEVKLGILHAVTGAQCPVYTAIIFSVRYRLHHCVAFLFFPLFSHASGSRPRASPQRLAFTSSAYSTNIVHRFVARTTTARTFCYLCEKGRADPDWRLCCWRDRAMGRRA